MARNLLRILGFLFTFGFVALIFGCQPDSQAENSKSSGSASAAESHAVARPETSLAKNAEKEDPGVAGNKEKTISKRSKLQTPPPPLTIPKVGLTDSLLATCLVNVGDIMPDGEVRTADGGKILLKSQYGDKFTVVFFWAEGKSNYTRLSANSALQDLRTDIAEPFAAKGIKVIGVNVGDNPSSIQERLQQRGVKLPYYFDPDKAFFSKAATSMLPRIYLLDASGKIVWFDTEYSQATRRNLMQAIQVSLGEK